MITWTFSKLLGQQHFLVALAYCVPGTFACHHHVGQSTLIEQEDRMADSLSMVAMKAAVVVVDLILEGLT